MILETSSEPRFVDEFSIAHRWVELSSLDERLC